MKLVTVIVLSLALFLSSCGPNAEEIAQKQRYHDDSVATVTANRIERKNKLIGQRKEFKEELAKYTAELEAARDKMNKLKEFHFLRTDSEREQQIKQQSLYISKLEEGVTTLTDNIGTIESNLANL